MMVGTEPSVTQDDEREAEACQLDLGLSPWILPRLVTHHDALQLRGPHTLGVIGLSSRMLSQFLRRRRHQGYIPAGES